ncbi:hypothetical protein QUF58_00790 [Anaerolineales bacterium HSG24]|nr:hypothetical protein [Anaerolineales bacterium HSG24]
MPISKKRKKRNKRNTYVDPAQRAERSTADKKKKFTRQQITIIIFSAVIIITMASSLIVSGLTPTSYVQPVTDGTDSSVTASPNQADGDETDETGDEKSTE